MKQSYESVQKEVDGIGIPVTKAPIEPRIIGDSTTASTQTNAGKDEYKQYDSSKKWKVAILPVNPKPLETISLEEREKN